MDKQAASIGAGDGGSAANEGLVGYDGAGLRVDHAPCGLRQGEKPSTPRYHLDGDRGGAGIRR